MVFTNVNILLDKIQCFITPMWVFLNVKHYITPKGCEIPMPLIINTEKKRTSLFPSLNQCNIYKKSNDCSLVVMISP